MVYLNFFNVHFNLSFGQTFEQNSTSNNLAYQQAFPKEYEDALNFIKNNKKIIDNELSNVPKTLLLSIIFPELTRYNIIKDFGEATTLKVLYVSFGEKYANFSIGNCQMKPTFAEYLEKYQQKYALKNLIKNSLKYEETDERTDEKTIRELRVGRLQDFAWQLKYLKVFYFMMEEKFSQKKWKNDTEKCVFYASAYNLGIYEEQKINNWATIKAFPNGKSKALAYTYASVAREYFLR